MLQVVLVGNLGADCEVKVSNGKSFISFRVAHTNRWTDDSGEKHEETTWVDCTINGESPIREYLRKGQMVYVQGTCSLRVYSSQKDRCMKAGMRINVRSIELLGSKTDDVPSQLIDPRDGSLINVQKWYYAPEVNFEGVEGETMELLGKSGDRYIVSNAGWVQRVKESAE